MQDKNELSDIVLNKSGASSSNKKTILAVATLGVVLIIVVLLMKPSSNEQESMVQPVPPKPQNTLVADTPNVEETLKEEASQEPLFEEVEVIEETPATDTDLDKIAQKLKEESQAQAAVETPVVQKKVTPKTVEKPKVVKKVAKTTQKHTPATSTKSVSAGHYYVQVGSFSRYEPNKKFLNNITRLGYKYKYHKVGNLKKVLVGPFSTRKEANKAKKVLRSKVEPGAFVVKI